MLYTYADDAVHNDPLQRGLRRVVQLMLEAMKTTELVLKTLPPRERRPFLTNLTIYPLEFQRPHFSINS